MAAYNAAKLHLDNLVRVRVELSVSLRLHVLLDPSGQAFDIGECITGSSVEQLKRYLLLVHTNTNLGELGLEDLEAVLSEVRRAALPNDLPMLIAIIISQLKLEKLTAAQHAAIKKQDGALERGRVKASRLQCLAFT